MSLSLFTLVTLVGVGDDGPVCGVRGQREHDHGAVGGLDLHLRTRGRVPLNHELMAQCKTDIYIGEVSQQINVLKRKLCCFLSPEQCVAVAPRQGQRRPPRQAPPHPWP